LGHWRFQWASPQSGHPNGGLLFPALCSVIFALPTSKLPWTHAFSSPLFPILLIFTINLSHIQFVGLDRPEIELPSHTINENISKMGKRGLVKVHGNLLVDLWVVQKSHYTMPGTTNHQLGARFVAKPTGKFPVETPVPQEP
jgi:hypothetical protein